ncbi:MAG: ArsR/SmtB family transcription factor [Burkholderiales bacterium]
MQSNLDQTFVALADPTRLAVVGLLRKKPRRSGDIAAALSMSRPTMSRHLRILRRAGLVEEAALEDDARARMYRLRQEPFSELRSWLEEVEAFWGDQLRTFKAHVERKYGRPRR